MVTLVINENMLKKLTKEAEDSSVEVCSVLIGLIQEDNYIVKEYVITGNIEMSPVSFKADPKDLSKAISKLSEKNYDIVGIFHSHPAPPTPSAKDIEGMKLWPQTVWLIYSTINHSLEAYILKNGEIIKVKLKATSNS